MNTNLFSVATLELGVVTSSIIELKSSSRYESTAFSLFKATINQCGYETISKQYRKYVDEILQIVERTKIKRILTVGYEAKFIDLLADSCKEYNELELVIIPNSQDVDFDRIQNNYPDNNVRVLSPFEAWECCRSITTLVVVPVIRLADESWQAYSFPNFFLTDDLKEYTYMDIVVEMLPPVEGIDYRTSRILSDLCHFSEIEYDFDKILTY